MFKKIQSQAGQGLVQATIIKSGIRRPDWITSSSKQRVVLVRDKSPSMEGAKARDATAASQDLVNELAQPANKNGFYVGIVDFSGKAKIVHPFAQAATVDGKVPAIKTSLFSGGTNITAGLEKALQLADCPHSNREQAHFLRPVTLLFSDGMHNTGPDPDSIADLLKERSDLVTVAFGDDADEDLLRKLATSPQHFYRCRNGRELRQFMATVGATLSQSIQSGGNATDMLSKMRQDRQNQQQ